MTAAPATVGPAVGDIVHYWNSWRGEITQYAAMVIALKEDGGVKLLVTSPNGDQWVASAPMWSNDPKPKHWSFRP